MTPRDVHLTHANRIPGTACYIVVGAGTGCYIVGGGAVGVAVGCCIVVGAGVPVAVVVGWYIAVGGGGGVGCNIVVGGAVGKPVYQPRCGEGRVGWVPRSVDPNQGRCG